MEEGKSYWVPQYFFVIHGFRAGFLRKIPKMPKWNPGSVLPLCQLLAQVCQFSGIILRQQKWIQLTLFVGLANFFGSFIFCWVFWLVGWFLHASSSPQQLLLNQGLSWSFFINGFMNSSVEKQGNSNASVEKVRIQTQTPLLVSLQAKVVEGPYGVGR